MKKNVCLMRVSTDMQETLAQRTAIEKYVQDNQIVIHEYIEEDGVSGFKTKLEDRVGLMKIKEMALNNEIEKLIIFNSDRIGRRMELVGFITLLDECGVKILSVTEGCLNDGNDTDSLISSIKMWMAEYESKKISERVKAGKKAVALKGEFLGGVPNYGYRLGEKRLIIDEEESEIMKLAFDLYIKGGSKLVLDTFHDKGILKRGKPWTRTKLIKTLKNTIYRGQKPLEDGEIPYDESLRIVSDEVFYRVQELMELRTTRKKGHTTKFLNRSDALLEGLLFHICGDEHIRKLHVDYGNYGVYKNVKEKKLLYRCSHCKNYKYEGVKKSYGGKKYHKLIEEHIKDVLNNLSIEKLEKEFNETKSENIDQIKILIANTTMNLKKKKKALENATSTLEKVFMGESSMDMETINTMIVKLKGEIVELEELLLTSKSELASQERSNINVGKLVEKYKDFEYIYEIADLHDKKMMLQELIDKIIISETDVEIILNI
ncbi:recombinase family protein [Romboutsia weinsteinii]|uniref:Recombinase family protein n=1 Tax=Romboutsia weinsteinii TaxID=2020949 RepID=A0A371J280_9FIRM|nr:recombinase family protein [Romboutsia weinsteinii]RDY26794.1 recombinase family protein [Romboutsia weinsteinii]